MHKMTLGAVAVAFSVLAAPVAHAQMKVTSDDIKNGAVSTKAMEAKVFGCDGSNISPSLKWTGAPEGTKSFAINLYDPDAPTGSGLLALGRVQHSGVDHFDPEECRRRESQTHARGRNPEPRPTTASTVMAACARRKATSRITIR